jgi:hypothetical protein
LPQNEQSSEWPKRIRDLTAAELDRLTIDENGHFYWDDKLINFEPPSPRSPQDPEFPLSELAAFELLEQAILELSNSQVEQTRSAERAAFETRLLNLEIIS